MSNLPPGVSPGDIDDHFGEPDRKVVHGVVHVGVSVEVPVTWTNKSIKGEMFNEVTNQLDEGSDLSVIHSEIEEVEPRS